jgi:hypothetical protein
VDVADYTYVTPSCLMLPLVSGYTKEGHGIAPMAQLQALEDLVQVPSLPTSWLCDQGKQLKLPEVYSLCLYNSTCLLKHCEDSPRWVHRFPAQCLSFRMCLLVTESSEGTTQARI